MKLIIISIENLFLNRNAKDENIGVSFAILQTVHTKKNNNWNNYLQE